MTRTELIELLQEFEDDMPVLYNTNTSGFGEIDSVRIVDGCLILEEEDPHE